MTTVSITDVRVRLNLDSSEIPDDSIQAYIDDAYILGASLSDPTMFVKAWACWRSFISSRTYKQMKLGELSITDEWSKRADELKADAESLGPGDLSYVASTAMYDDRPDDPYEMGTKVKESDIVHSM